MSWLQAAYARYKAILSEHRLRYLSYCGQILAWIRNRNLTFELLTLDDIRTLRRSDTLFVLGSGPSLLRLTDRHWQHVREHDSFGINFSLLIDFVPTYHIMEDGKTPWLREHIIRVLAAKRRVLSSCIWFVSNKHIRRLIHPRYAPEFFPEHPRVCVFTQRRRILLERDRPFTAEDFKRAIVYRGTLSVVLYLAMQLGYRRIVLLGVDLHTSGHFFDNHPEMQVYMENVQKMWRDRGINRDGQPYAAMIPERGKYRPFDEYLYALNELYLRPQGVRLYVANLDNMLCPRIPPYDWEGEGDMRSLQSHAGRGPREYWAERSSEGIDV